MRLLRWLRWKRWPVELVSPHGQTKFASSHLWKTGASFQANDLAIYMEREDLSSLWHIRITSPRGEQYKWPD